MRIFKIALLLAGGMFATQGSTFDLTHMAFKALGGIAKEYSTHTSSGKPTKAAAQAVDVELPRYTGNFDQCRQLFANGTPPEVPDAKSRRARALCFDGFAVLHSGSTKTPVYTAEVINRASVQAARNEQRTDIFFADNRIPPTERATLEDFQGSGFDRGHMVAAANRDNSQSMAQSFALSNIVPQMPNNNRKTYAGIEKATRQYALRAGGDVFVITGPHFDRNSCPVVASARRALEDHDIQAPQEPADIVHTAKAQAGFKDSTRYTSLSDCTIGRGVGVPSHIFKLVYDSQTGRAWAHWLQNTDWAQVSKPISYDELVRRTGIEFLPGIRPHS